jgi:hypothetical protein
LTFADCLREFGVFAHSFAKIVGSAYWNDMVPDPSIGIIEVPHSCGHYHSMARPLPINCGKRCVRHNGIITLKTSGKPIWHCRGDSENDRPLPIPATAKCKSINGGNNRVF